MHVTCNWPNRTLPFQDPSLGPLSLALRSSSLPRHVVPGVSLPTSQEPGLMFAPKCLALVSR